MREIIERVKEKVRKIEEGTFRMVNKEELAKFIDHTLLKPEATYRDFERLCEEAIKWKPFAVCVPPTFVSFVKERLRNTGVGICSVVGFPLGSTFPSIKAREAEELVKLGVDEIDMVINVGNLKSGNWDYVLREIREVLNACSGRTLKVIIETALLTDEEKIRAAKIVVEAGAQFVKTSTGFGSGGATLYDVALLKEVIGENSKVKASGGIRTYEDTVKMIAAGASRIGTSRGAQIMEEAPY
jgi:deoxyribose-phosphate aldolase